MNRLTRLIGVIAIALTAHAAHAQFPARAIHFVVPFPAGGSTDTAARIIGDSMAESLKQPIVIDNKPGGDGVVAGDLVAKSPPDGYTVLFGGAGSLSYAPVARPSIPYDPIADFTPIGRIGYFALFLFVRDDLSAHSLKELLALARSNPAGLNYGTSNATAVVATAQFMQSAGVKMTHIPYKGDAPMLTDMLGGRVDLAFAAGGAFPYLQAGKLRVLAAVLPSRSELLPEVPTLIEEGIDSVSVAPWVGLFGPANLPPDARDRLSAELAQALGRADVRAKLRKLAIETVPSSPGELGLQVRAQLNVWRKAFKAANIVVE